MYNCKKNWTDEDFEELNSNKFIGVIVGGGGLFYSSNKNSQQQISGWQCKVPTSAWENLRPALVVFGVGYNNFRSGDEKFTSAFRPNLHALAKKSTLIGLREGQSLREMVPWVEPTLYKEKLKYQPCATTLMALIKPELRNQHLLGDTKVISVNPALDRLDSRLEGRTKQVMEGVARGLRRAQNDGWKILLTEHQPGDTQPLIPFAKKYGLNYGDIQKIYKGGPPKYGKKLFDLYKNVTISMSMRGHGILIPFGMQAGTISLISHEKVASFVQDIGHEEWGIELTQSRRSNRPGDLADSLADEVYQKVQYYALNRQKIYAELLEAQKKIYRITEENMKVMRDAMVRRARVVYPDLA